VVPLGVLAWAVRNIHTAFQAVVKEISGDPDIRMVEDNETRVDVVVLEPEAVLRWNSDAAVAHAWVSLVVDRQDTEDPSVRKNCGHRMRKGKPPDSRWHVEEDFGSRNDRVKPKFPTVLNMDVNTDWEGAEEEVDHPEGSSSFLCDRPRMPPKNHTDQAVAAAS
jgi:hypothetical protein